jgi:hypothetical protein
MPEQITPRAKRLRIMAMATPWLVLAVYFGTPFLNTQTRHLRAVDAHIKKIAPQWERFRATHTGFDQVTFFAYTAGDGMFGASGHVATDEQLSELRKFMENTAPPRPVFLDSVQVAGPEFIEPQKAEQGAAANGSQPSRSETNQISSASGSRH